MSIFSMASAVEVLDAQQSQALGQLKIGYINQQIMFEESAVAKLLKPNREAQQRLIAAKIDELYAEYTKLVKEYENLEAISSEAEILSMQQGIKQKEFEVQSLQQQQQQLVTQYTQNFSQEFITPFNSALELVVAEKQLDVVFDGASMLYVNPSLDISADVIKKFDELTQAQYQNIKAQLEAQQTTAQ